MWGLGVGEIVIIGLVLVLMFGGSKFPSIARGLGEGIRNFKGELGGRTTDQRDQGPKALGDGERGKKAQ